MEKSHRELKFEQSINQWTLWFYDPADEENFRKKLRRTLPLPKAMKAAVCVGLFVVILYRTFTVVVAWTGGSSVQTGTFGQELFMLLLCFGCVAIELLMRLAKKFEAIHGLFLYNCIPIVCFTSGFFTYKAPLFGVAYYQI
ncbi:MAG: hypothetical protein P4M11_02930 [Candidatus Pacebacteria bacterium]|nr:hypothetical protein [Candidatus Paceibacterota bacterium]